MTKRLIITKHEKAGQAPQKNLSIKKISRDL